MKVLEPWAGIRLASGHPLFHLAQFTASWIALSTGKNEPDAPSEVVSAFKLLQWGHFACFMLYFLANFARRYRALSSTEDDDSAGEKDPSAAEKGDPSADTL